QNGKTIKAGEYAFLKSITTKQLVDKFIKGDVILHAITLTEGMTYQEALRVIQFHPAIKKTLWGKSQSEVMALLGETLQPEGLFFPDTYYFKENATDLFILKQARKTMISKLTQAWENKDPDIVLKTPYEALILASIIEKETACDSERHKVSGVFQR